MNRPSWSEIFGRSVRQNRKANGWTQRALAHLARVKVEAIQLIEAGGMDYAGEEETDRVCDVLGLIGPTIWYTCGQRH